MSGSSNSNPRKLPPSTIYGFNGTFPGPRINASYGRPAIVRLENHLDVDNGFDRQDFGSPNASFITHLHNGHTAAESDGNSAHGHARFSPLGRPGRARPGLHRDELQGQYRLPDGTQCMKLVQIANERGLLPKPVVRDSLMFAWQIVP